MEAQTSEHTPLHVLGGAQAHQMQSVGFRVVPWNVDEVNAVMQRPTRGSPSLNIESHSFPSRTIPKVIEIHQVILSSIGWTTSQSLLELYDFKP